MSLTAGELSAMRDISDNILTQTCTIMRPTRVADDAGGYGTALGTVAANVSCRIATKSNAMIGKDMLEQSEALVGALDYILKLPYDQAVAVDDRIVVGSETYIAEIVWEDHQWVMVKRVKISKLE